MTLVVILVTPLMRPCSILWSEESNLTDNYEANSLLLDANKRFGRNRHASAGVRDVEAKVAAGEETYEDDDGGWDAERMVE